MHKALFAVDAKAPKMDPEEIGREEKSATHFWTRQ
jgi:hypothetical protein